LLHHKPGLIQSLAQLFLPGGHRHCHRLEREPADLDARRRGGALMALQLIHRQLPFPLRGIDADNDPVYGLWPIAFT
jgi:hypothetical protein